MKHLFLCAENHMAIYKQPHSLLHSLLQHISSCMHEYYCEDKLKS